jgi:ribonuclease Z
VPADLYRGIRLSRSLDQYMRIYFLATGGPHLSKTRHGIATLVYVNGHWFLFDVGRATLQRMGECGIPVRDVTKVFFTHLHSDHICGMSDFWMTGWFVEQRGQPLQIWGPLGTKRFISGLHEVHHFDLSIRLRYQKAPPAGVMFHTTEFTTGLVYAADGITISAFEVDHGMDVRPAYGFKIEWNGLVLVLSGDTTLCEGVMENAAGCDLLVHEIAAAADELLEENSTTRHIVSIHTDPDQMAEICNRTKPRLTMLNHVNQWQVNRFDILHRIRSKYSGLIDMAEDRMEVLLGPDIRVIPPESRMESTAKHEELLD